MKNKNTPAYTNGWISVDTPPELGDEYNVAWDLEDGEDKLAVTTMEYDAIKKEWYDVIGHNPVPVTTVKFWRELPEPPYL
jgi:hypothetical protein